MGHFVAGIDALSGSQVSAALAIFSNKMFLFRRRQPQVLSIAGYAARALRALLSDKFQLRICVIYWVFSRASNAHQCVAPAFDDAQGIPPHPTSRAYTAMTREDNSKRRRTKLTPPELGAKWGVAPDKILGWIRTGELRAMNAASREGGRPRFLIDVADVAAFETRRAVVPPVATRRPRRQRENHATEYF